MVGRHRHERRNILAHLLALPSVTRQNRETRSKAEKLLARVGLSGLADRAAGTLPYGALKRLEIARALATEPKVLLLDEPAAGCNPVETSEIESIIRSIARDDGVTVVLVEHDMRLVMNVSDRIHVLANGRTLAEGTAAEVRANQAVIEAYLGVEARQRRRPAVLTVENLNSGYGRIEALHGVSIEVKAGEIVTLVGGNGAGKTTLLRAISGVQPISSGRILYEGRADRARVRAPAGRARHRTSAGGSAAVRATFGRGQSQARRVDPPDEEFRGNVGADFRVVSDAYRNYGTPPPVRCPAASSRCSPSAAR